MIASIRCKISNNTILRGISMSVKAPPSWSHQGIWVMQPWVQMQMWTHQWIGRMSLSNQSCENKPHGKETACPLRSPHNQWYYKGWGGPVMIHGNSRSKRCFPAPKTQISHQEEESRPKYCSNRSVDRSVPHWKKKTFMKSKDSTDKYLQKCRELTVIYAHFTFEDVQEFRRTQGTLKWQASSEFPRAFKCNHYGLHGNPSRLTL